MKIVVLDGYTAMQNDLDWESLYSLGECFVYDRTPKEQVIEKAKDAEVILTNKTVIDKEILSKLPNLKYIGVLATGYNVIDVEAAREKNIIVTNIPGYSTNSVAQMVFALLLELTNHVQIHSQSVRDGKWASSKDFCFMDTPQIELFQKTIGIIGFGKTGQKTADIAQAIGMNIISYSRTKTDQTHRPNFKWVELDELFETADVVSLHCPLTKETRGLVCWDRLKQMKSSAFLINTSRGPIIVEEDLAKALNNGEVAGAGLDVLSKEPPKDDNPLFSAKNCIITPHIAWATKEARQRLIQIAIDNLKAYRNGNPINRV